MRRALLVWLVGSAAGVVLLALPDQGPRLVAFSRAHGLTALDALGAALLIGGWLPAAAHAWRRREELRRRAPQRAVAAAPFACGLRSGLVIASAASDFAGWWAVGAALLVLVQAAAFVVLARS